MAHASLAKIQHSDNKQANWIIIKCFKGECADIYLTIKLSIPHLQSILINVILCQPLSDSEAVIIFSFVSLKWTERNGSPSKLFRGELSEIRIELG